jgi:surface antigen
MRVSLAFGLCMAAALLTAGCSLMGGGGDREVAEAVPPAPAVAAPVSYGAFLQGPIASKLTQADKDKALASQQEALASGQRKTWKGDHGTFGYVEPAASTAAAPPSGDTCKAFTSTIFIAGRPQVGHGTGCQNPDGTYRIAS